MRDIDKDEDVWDHNRIPQIHFCTLELLWPGFYLNGLCITYAEHHLHKGSSFSH